MIFYSVPRKLKFTCQSIFYFYQNCLLKTFLMTLCASSNLIYLSVLSKLLSPDAKTWLIGKDPDAAKTEGRRKKGTTEDEMIGWHHWLNGHSLSKLREVVKDKEAWHAMVHGAAKSQTWLSNWTTTTIVCLRKKNTIDSSTEKEREGHETSVVNTIPE